MTFLFHRNCQAVRFGSRAFVGCLGYHMEKVIPEDRDKHGPGGHGSNPWDGQYGSQETLLLFSYFGWGLYTSHPLPGPADLPSITAPPACADLFLGCDTRAYAVVWGPHTSHSSHQRQGLAPLPRPLHEPSSPAWAHKGRTSAGMPRDFPARQQGFWLNPVRGVSALDTATCKGRTSAPATAAAEPPGQPVLPDAATLGTQPLDT